MLAQNLLLGMALFNVLLVALPHSVNGFVITCQHSPMRQGRTDTPRFLSDGWSDFSALDDEDDDIFSDEPSDKPQMQDSKYVGLPTPTIERDAEPMWVESGESVDLSEDSVMGVLSACRQEIGTLFGYTAENRAVGITGGVDFVELDGPTVIIRLKGRFWHTRQTVLERVTAYILGRIPEVVDVAIEDPWQLTNEANDIW